MEKKEKSPAVMQGENRWLLLQASHKAVCVESQNRVQLNVRINNILFRNTFEHINRRLLHGFTDRELTILLDMEMEEPFVFNLIRFIGMRSDMSPMVSGILWSLIGSFVGIIIAELLVKHN
ncbi:hypothetical protein [Phascolarctobacterium sp.]